MISNLTAKKIIDYFSFLLAYSFLLPVYTVFSKKSENIVGLCSNYFGSNIKYLYEEMSAYKRITVFFVTGNKKELERLKTSNVNAYYNRDIRNVPLFLSTDVWVVTQGPGEIPITFRMGGILKKLFGINYRQKHRGRWVVMWHGVGGGFKLSRSCMRKMFAQYDLAFTASDFYKHHSKEDEISQKMRTTGYPRTDLLLKKALSRREVLNMLGLPLDRKNILYAPTWAHYYRDFLWETTQSFEDIEDFCKTNNCSFLTRMHHFWYRRNPKKRRNLEEKTKQSKYIFDLSPQKYADVQHILYIADVLITDWSSIVNDFILLNRPMIFLDTELPTREVGTYQLGPEDRVGYIVKNRAQFFEKLQEAIDNPKLFEKKRRAIIKKLYEHLDGNSSKRCAQEIVKLLKR